MRTTARLALVVAVLFAAGCRAEPPEDTAPRRGAYVGLTGMPQLNSASYHLGGAVGSSAGELVDAGTLIQFGCYLCADAANSVSVFCSADSAVVVTAGSAHQGTPLPAAGPCAWFPVRDASALYCVSSSPSQNYSAQCY